MTIQEAIKSGKKIKRNHWDCWINTATEFTIEIRIESILADDWEIVKEKQKITLTVEQIRAALKTDTVQSEWYENRVLKLLGFTEF